jgi:hypothetical protein
LFHGGKTDGGSAMFSPDGKMFRALKNGKEKKLERAKGFEPSTFTLAR